MRYTIPLLSLFVFLLTACSPCGDNDCFPDNAAAMRIVNTDGEDLVFGEAPKYNRRSIKIYTVSGANDTLFAACDPLLLYPGTDTILYVAFIPNVRNYFMELGNGDVDTLDLSGTSSHTRCCGDVYRIGSIRVNGKALVQDSARWLLEK